MNDTTRTISPAPKFWLGDHVVGISCYRKEVQTPCQDCAGAGNIALKSGPGRCPTCYGRGCDTTYENTAWRLSDDHMPHTVRDVRMRVYLGEHEEGYMCEGTGVGSGTLWPADRLFATRDEAQAECDRRNAMLEGADMKSHPLIAAARDFAQTCYVGAKEGAAEHRDQLRAIVDMLPPEPLTIVPCAWLVEAARYVWPIGQTTANYDEERRYELAAKLRGACERSES